MNCKFLEISSGQNLPSSEFEIVEVEKNIFMLKTQISHVRLLGTLEMWLESNYSVEESSYSDMLLKRSSSMRQVLSEDMTSDFNLDQMAITESMVENSPRPDLESMIEKAD